MAVEGAGKVYTVDATFQTLFSNGLTAMAARESLPEMKLEGIMSVQVENNGESIALKSRKMMSGPWRTAQRQTAAL